MFGNEVLYKVSTVKFPNPGSKSQGVVMVAKIGRGRNGKGSKCPATTISAHGKVGKIVYIKILSKSLA